MPKWMESSKYLFLGLEMVRREIHSLRPDYFGGSSFMDKYAVESGLFSPESHQFKSGKSLQAIVPSICSRVESLPGAVPGARRRQWSDA